MTRCKSSTLIPDPNAHPLSITRKTADSRSPSAFRYLQPHTLFVQLKFTVHPDYLPASFQILQLHLLRSPRLNLVLQRRWRAKGRPVGDLPEPDRAFTGLLAVFDPAGVRITGAGATAGAETENATDGAEEGFGRHAMEDWAEKGEAGADDGEAAFRDCPVEKRGFVI